MRRRLAVVFAAVMLLLPFGGSAATEPPDASARAIAAGQAAYDRGDLQSAVATWNAVLPALEAANDPKSVARVLFLLGISYYQLNDFPHALATLQRAADLHQKLGDELAEGDDLGNLGNVAEGQGRLTDALALQQQALALHRGLGRRDRESDDLTNIGVALTELGRATEALSVNQQALALHLEFKDRAGEASDYTNIGLNYSELARYADAIAAHNQSLTIHRDLKDRLGEARDLGNLGNAQESLGRYAESLASYQQALDIARAIGNRLEESDEMSNVGNVLKDLARYEEALAVQRQALIIHRQLGAHLTEANDLSSIGNVLENLGRYEEALASQREALAIDRRIGRRTGEANDLTNAGVDEADLGRFDDALASQEEALAIDRALGNRVGEAASLTNIGNVVLKLGSFDAALADQQQAFAIDNAIGDRHGASVALINIGNIQRQLGHVADAQASYSQALTIDRALGNRLGEASDLSGIGNTQFQLGRYDDALASHRQALAIHREIGNLPGVAVDLDNIAMIAESRGAHADALAAASESSVLAKRLSDSTELWKGLAVMARANRHLQHREAALAGYDAAIEQIEALRAGLSGSERGGFLADKLYVYDEYIAYLRDLDGQFPGKGYDRKAFEIFERKSARAAVDQIGLSAAHHFRGVDAQVVAAEDAALAAVDAAQAQLSKVLSTGDVDQAALTAARQRLADTKEHAAAIESNIATQYPAYSQLRHPQPLGADTLQQKVLRPGELMLVYEVFAGQSTLWLISRDGIRLFPVAGSETLDPAVARLGAHVSGMLSLLGSGTRSGEKLERAAAADLPGYAADSYALYRMLVPESAASALAQAKSVIVVPSGSLYRVAFEALVTAEPAGAARPHYLLDDVPVSYVPSASLLAVVRGSYAQPSAGRGPLLAFANPAFGAGAPDGARGLSAYDRLQLTAARSAFGGAVFPSLPGTETEAVAVRAALHAPDASVVSGDAATRGRLLELNAGGKLKDYRYLLFATHAVLPSEIEGLTQPAIVLAHPERGDGLLTMADVFGLALDADFVTLSACNTGVDTADSSGAGISGLTRAFLYAGTPAISATLWEVDDAAAPQITPPFFAAMQNGALSPAQALRRAKLALLASPAARFRHPYAWAPSVIFGDGDAGGTIGL